MTYISEIKGRSGKDHIDSVMKRVGPLLDVHAVDAAIIQGWTGILPDILMDFWRNHGIGALQGGLMRLCLPGEFDGLLSQVFHADQDFSHKDCHVIGYGPFGSLVVWSERHWIVKVELLTSQVTCVGLMDETKKRNPDASIVSSLLGHPADSLDHVGEDNKKLFARAEKKLGRPGPSQAFGFVPALAMGGTPRLENIKVQPALEHFLFLAQLKQFELWDYLGTPGGFVRQIG